MLLLTEPTPQSRLSSGTERLPESQNRANEGDQMYCCARNGPRLLHGPGVTVSSTPFHSQVSPFGYPLGGPRLKEQDSILPQGETPSNLE